MESENLGYSLKNDIPIPLKASYIFEKYDG